MAEIGGTRLRVLMSGPVAEDIKLKGAVGRWEDGSGEPLFARTGVPHTPTPNALTTTYIIWDFGLTEGFDPQGVWTVDPAGFLVYTGVHPLVVVSIQTQLSFSRGAGGTEQLDWQWAFRSDGAAPTPADIFAPLHSQTVSSNAVQTIDPGTLLLMTPGSSVAMMMKLAAGARTYNTEGSTVAVSAEG